MDWSLITVLVLVGGFFLWRQSKGAETAKAATARLEKDTKLYRRIKEGMREYQWRNSKQSFSSRGFLPGTSKTGELLFETAHLSAFYVDHFVEFRVGFYFKDLDEYGLFCFFGDDGEIESYYRTDRTFQKEEMLLTNDEDQQLL